MEFSFLFPVCVIADHPSRHSERRILLVVRLSPPLCASWSASLYSQLGPSYGHDEASDSGVCVVLIGDIHAASCSLGLPFSSDRYYMFILPDNIDLL